MTQLLRRYYEVGTKEGPNLLGRFLSAIAECSESVTSCNVSFAYAFTKVQVFHNYIFDNEQPDKS